MIKKLITLLILVFTFTDLYSQREISDLFSVDWPPKKMYIRVFKYEKELEVWVSDSTDFFYLYKKYNICKLSGDFGPKRKQNDLQVPEGFYYIDQFNPYSNYHLSLGINYPNESDKILGKQGDLGGLIYIHGSCVSVGCIAVGNENIDEIYDLARRIKGKIEVDIFPINYNRLSSLLYFDERIKKRPDLVEFEQNIYQGFNYFEESNTLPKISVKENGFYSFE